MSPIRLAAAATLAALLTPTTPALAQDASTPCLAVVLPSVQGVEGSATDVAGGLRDLLVSFLTGPALRVITLEARLPAQAAIEARQKSCERMLLTTMVRKRDSGSRLGGVLGQAAGTAAWHIPYGGGAAMARGAAIAGAQAASTLARPSAVVMSAATAVTAQSQVMISRAPRSTSAATPSSESP